MTRIFYEFYLQMRRLRRERRESDKWNKTVSENATLSLNRQRRSNFDFLPEGTTFSYFFEFTGILFGYNEDFDQKYILDFPVVYNFPSRDTKRRSPRSSPRLSRSSRSPSSPTSTVLDVIHHVQNMFSRCI
ncbi:uncharacterized protein LOC111717307 isoform X2 [Eurytemora carolleeae]|uniref:uncharacterized protein LOC111717307 isoform X2 n=1 Tax=Eurytemora carolleeae TaxID=1294199 RepID=UPI000C773189|nr:uncharacterized protein LOC111717307 isoform X2 [Eurytemora carolleeae]|eukprot:XP_023348576.1 uncharacterized protein LOC111717307 isoform X2 [Eurytemora affinis]